MLNFLMKIFQKSFDKIVRMRIFLTDPDTRKFRIKDPGLGGQLTTDPPDPEYCWKCSSGHFCTLLSV